MFLDTSFNSLNTVLSTIHQNFVETAMKYYRYVKSMTINKKPPVALLIGRPPCPFLDRRSWLYRNDGGAFFAGRDVKRWK